MEANNNYNPESNQEVNPTSMYRQQPGGEPYALPTMGFGEAVTVCFKKYFDFTGRARRSEYWYFVLFTALLGFVGGFLDGLFGWKIQGTKVMSSLLNVAVFLPTIAVCVRRFHDIGKSGWWVVGACVLVALLAELSGLCCQRDIAVLLSGVVVMAISIVMLYFLCTDSQRGENKYGPSPKYQ